jgi:hypothetical protein
MNKAKSAIKKVKKIQSKVDKVVSKVNKIHNVITHPAESLGGVVGSKLGSRTKGRKVGKFVGNIFGTGDYTVLSNTLATKSVVSDGNVPQFTSASRGIRITHREYLGDIVASPTAGAFTINKYAINPGLFASFPWLCSIASQFDQWRPNGIVVCVNSLSSSYSGTSSLGTVVVATDYDVLDPPYINKVEMENSEFATSGNTATSLIHPIECKASERAQRVYNTRTAAVPSNDNIRFYDFCNVYVATAGCTSNQVVGELWISYDITFFKPQLAGGLLGRSLLSYYAEGTTGITTANPIAASNLTVNPNSNISPTFNLTDITFPANLTSSTFLVTLIWTAAPGTPATSVTYTSGCVAGPQVNPGTGSLIYTLTGTGSCMTQFTVRLQGNYTTVQTVTLNGVNLTACTYAAINIQQINPDI